MKQEQHYLQLLNFKGKTKNWLKGVRFYCLIKELYMILNICKILLDEVVDKINFWFNESKTLLWTQCQTNFKSKHVMYIFPFVHMLIGDAYEFLLWEWEDFCSVFLPIVSAKRKRLVSCHALILVSGKIKSRGRWEPTFSKSGKFFCMVNNVSRGLFSIGVRLFFFYGNKFGFRTQTIYQFVN